jgi:hypothetical protein
MMNALEVIGERLASIEAAVASGSPLLMTRAQYAARVAYSTRHLDGVLSPECYAGAGRSKRIVVAKADAFLLSSTSERDNGNHDDAHEGDEVERSAKRAARRAK